MPYSTAINVNLSKETPVACRFYLDSDPDDAKVNYGSPEMFGDGRLKLNFPDCLAKGQAGNFQIIAAPGMASSNTIRFNTGDPEGGSITLIAGANPFD